METISTGRTLEEYTERVFPEFKTKSELLDYLNGKTIVDVGSGLTHKNPYSLINEGLRDKNRNIKYINLEPKLAGKGDFKFTFKDKLAEKSRVLIEKLDRQELFRFPEKPAKKMSVAAMAEELPFGDSSVDILLSVGLVGYWITDLNDLEKIIKEFSRVLKQKGEVRIHYVKPEIVEPLTQLAKVWDFNVGANKYTGFVKLTKANQ